MVRLYLLLIIVLIFSCKEVKVESFQLKDINLDKVYNDSSCIKKTEWIQKDFFKYEIDKFSKKYNNYLFEKVLVAHFSSEGEVVDYNSLVMLSFENGNTKVIHESNKSIDSITLDNYSLDKMIDKLKKKGYGYSSSQITLIEFKKESFQCYYHESYLNSVFESLKNLDFFNDKKLDLAIDLENEEWERMIEKYKKSD